MLTPLTRITDATRTAANGSLSHRIELPGRTDEFRELADAFDTISITQAHDGTLTLTPRAAGGLRVTVQLPAAPPRAGSTLDQGAVPSSATSARPDNGALPARDRRHS
jgi:hypothetical protein